MRNSALQSASICILNLLLTFNQETYSIGQLTNAPLFYIFPMIAILCVVVVVVVVVGIGK